MALITCKSCDTNKYATFETIGEIREQREYLRADQHIERGYGLIECDHGRVL